MRTLGTCALNYITRNLGTPHNTCRASTVPDPVGTLQVAYWLSPSATPCLGHTRKQSPLAHTCRVYTAPARPLALTPPRFPSLLVFLETQL